MKFLTKITFSTLVLMSLSCVKSNCYECEAIEVGGNIVYEEQTFCEGDNGWSEEELENEVMAFENMGSQCRKK